MAVSVVVQRALQAPCDSFFVAEEPLVGAAFEVLHHVVALWTLDARVPFDERQLTSWILKGFAIVESWQRSCVVGVLSRHPNIREPFLQKLLVITHVAVWLLRIRIEPLLVLVILCLYQLIHAVLGGEIGIQGLLLTGQLPRLLII